MMMAAVAPAESNSLGWLLVAWLAISLVPCGNVSDRGGEVDAGANAESQTNYVELKSINYTRYCGQSEQRPQS